MSDSRATTNAHISYFRCSLGDMSDEIRKIRNEARTRSVKGDVSEEVVHRLLDGLDAPAPAPRNPVEPILWKVQGEITDRGKEA
jgi:hypothetical protein